MFSETESKSVADHLRLKISSQPGNRFSKSLANLQDGCASIGWVCSGRELL